MSKKKIAALAVGGWMVIGTIGNAVSHSDSNQSHKQTSVQARVDPGAVKAAPKPKPKPKPKICGLGDYQFDSPATADCKEPPKPWCGRADQYGIREPAHPTEAQKNYWPDECRETGPQIRAGRAREARETAQADADLKKPGNCFDKSAAVAITGLLSLDPEAAIAGGKNAWSTAGTGEQC
jgi:hypothetical protein